MGQHQRPAKIRNISGLHNQCKDPSLEDSQPTHSIPQASRSRAINTMRKFVNKTKLKTPFDGLKADYEEDASESGDSEGEETSDWEDLNEEAFSEFLM